MNTKINIERLRARCTDVKVALRVMSGEKKYRCEIGIGKVGGIEKESTRASGKKGKIMTNTAQELKIPNIRAKEIIRLLTLYGPLHLYTINQLIKPSINKKRLKDVLLRLIRRGFIKKRGEKMLDSKNIYYELSKSRIALELLAEFMEMSIESLRQPHIRTVELLHAQYCAIWADKLKRLYPDAVVVPDHKISCSMEAKELLQLSFEDKDVYPDLLLFFPQKDTNPSVGIAVEIERTRKSSKRLVKKISKYSNLTLLDGVLYVCEKSIIADVIMDIFKSKVLPRSYRIQHYEKNFFMFSYLMGMGKMPSDEMFNREGEDILLQDWIRYLRKTEHYDRDNNLLGTRADVAPPNGCPF